MWWSGWLLMASFIFCFLQEICTSCATGQEGSRGKSITGLPLSVCVGSWLGHSTVKTILLGHQISQSPPWFLSLISAQRMWHCSLPGSKGSLNWEEHVCIFFSEHKKITVAQGEEWVVLIYRDNDFRWLCVCKGTVIPGAVWFLPVSYPPCPALSPHPSFQCTQRVSLLLPHLCCLSCLGVRWDEDSLECPQTSAILLPPECWDYRHMPSALPDYCVYSVIPAFRCYFLQLRVTAGVGLDTQLPNTLKTINGKAMALAFTVSAAGLCLESAHIDRHLNFEFHCCPLGCRVAKYWMY